MLFRSFQAPALVQYQAEKYLPYYYFNTGRPELNAGSNPKTGIMGTTITIKFRGNANNVVLAAPAAVTHSLKYDTFPATYNRSVFALESIAFSHVWNNILQQLGCSLPQRFLTISSGLFLKIKYSEIWIQWTPYTTVPWIQRTFAPP